MVFMVSTLSISSAQACTPSPHAERVMRDVQERFSATPFDPLVVERWAHALEGVCRNDEAYQMWERMLLLQPTDPEVLRRMALNRSSKDPAHATALFRQYSMRPGVSLTSETYCSSVETFITQLDRSGTREASDAFLGWLERSSGNASCDAVRRERPVAASVGVPLQIVSTPHRSLNNAWLLLFSPLFLGLLWLEGGRSPTERWTLERLQQERPDLAHIIGVECGWLHHDVLRHGLGGIHAAASAMEAGDEEAWLWLRERLSGVDGVVEQLHRFTNALEVLLARELEGTRGKGAFPLLEEVASVTRELQRQLLTSTISTRMRSKSLYELATKIEEDVCPRLVVSARLGETFVVSQEWIERVWARVLGEGERECPRVRLHVEMKHERLYAWIPQRDLTSVLSNLLRNAVEASHASGQVDVRLRVSACVCPMSGQHRLHLGVGDAAPTGWEHVRGGQRDAKRGLGLVDALVQRAGGLVVFSEDGLGLKWATLVLGRVP
jgi:signal transduction histidine kinase